MLMFYGTLFGVECLLSSNSTWTF